MPYQVTPESVVKVMKQLETLANAKEDEVTFLTHSPNSLRYALHQAFKAAKELNFQKYANLGEIWKIRVRGTRIICERKDVFNPLDNSAGDEVRKKRYTADKLPHILGAVLAEGDRFEVQYFPGYVLSKDEETQLMPLLLKKNKKFYYDDDPNNGLTIETNV